MKRLKISVVCIIASVFALCGCSKDDDSKPIVTASVFESGQPTKGNNLITTIGTDVSYKFEIKTPGSEIKKLELWKFEGEGINRQEPVKMGVWVYPTAKLGDSYVIEHDEPGLNRDVRYSVYVQDMNDNFTTAQVNLTLDIMSYSQQLTDGMSNGTSKTFLNLESGRTFYIANTIGDPKGMDLGFTYMEKQSDGKACLVSFDEYYKTGNYAMVANSLNPATSLKDATEWFGDATLSDKIKVKSDLKDAYDNADPITPILIYSADKIAKNLNVGDIIAFKTQDGRYGVIDVTDLDRKAEALTNSQTLSIDVMVQKKNIK